MSRQVTTAQLWETIRNSGLASADECRRWAKGVTDALGKSVAADPEQLVASLVKFGYLTHYQGNVLFQALSNPLVLGEVRIEKSLEEVLGANWYEGRGASPNADTQGSGERIWVAALSMETLSSSEVLDWPPSAAWAEIHTRVDASQLDCWKNSGATLQHLYATVEPWNSRSLATELVTGPLHAEQALRMVKDVAAGLHALHEAGLVHGHLSLDAILVEADGSFRLRRDPLFPPRSPYHGTAPSLIPHSHSLLAVAAPELALPDALPTIQSDLYALGCIWYRARVGAWPVEPAVGASAISWGALHARIPVPIPNQFSEIAGKCLMYLMAKEPAVRFRSASAFLNALASDTEQQSIAKSSTTKDPAIVAQVVRESSADYVTKAPTKSSGAAKSSTNPKPAAYPKPANPKPVAPVKPSTTAQPAITPPTATPPNVHVPSTSSQPAPAAKVTTEKPTSPTPAVKPPDPTSVPEVPQIDESTVERVASEIRDKKGRVGNRNPYRPSEPKEPIANRIPLGAVAPDTTVGPDKENSEKDAVEAKAKPKKRRRKRPPNQGNPKPSTSKSKGKKKSSRPIWLMPVLIASSFLVLLVLLAILRSNAPSVVTIENNPNKPINRDRPKSQDSNNAIANNPAPAADPLSQRYEIRPDDGNAPWAPPTVGPPCSTDLFPMGIEAMVSLSSRAWQHQGPVGPLITWWDSLASEPRSPWWPDTAAPIETIEHVTIAWYPGKEPGSARYAVRFAFKDPRKTMDVINTSEWNPKAISSGSATGSMWIRKGNSGLNAMLCDDLSASPAATTKQVTFGPEDLLETILATKETPLVMRRQLEILRQASDASSDLTLLVAPSFLYGDGKEIGGPESPRVLSLLSQVVDDKVQAFMLRAQWDKAWYLEWRSLGNDLQAASRNAANIKKQIDEAANQLETALVNQPADPYWRAIANRFPQMLRALSKWMRTGSEEGQVIANVYLPQEAVPNLLIGSWMAAQREWKAVATAPANTKPTAPSKGIEQWLETPISLRVEQDSLENLLQAIATELKEVSKSASDPVPMAINGTAFQKDGITRNQQVRNFEYTDTPVRQVLTALARRVNPVTTVQAPNEKDQKVVWVILDDASTASKKKLEFTTRAWTDTNKASLPAEFVVPDN